jgi:hypothetical protein
MKETNSTIENGQENKEVFPTRNKKGTNENILNRKIHIE